MSDVISGLTLLEPEQICFHESYETARLDKICRAIEEEGVLRNPPPIVKMPNGNYLLLDGAHRMMALKALGCQQVAVQVVPDDRVELSSWKHLLPIGGWWDVLKQDPLIGWSDEPIEDRMLAHVTEANGRTHYLYALGTDQSLFSHLKSWHRVVSLYQHDYFVRRIPQNVHTQVGEGELLLSFHEYTLQELKQVVEANQLMPAGVTRMMIDGRMLNLRIPLELLRNPSREQAESDWNSLRDGWAKSLRLYTEPVYICEA